MKFQKILAPTDFSEASVPALVYALELAEQFGGTVTLLHAYGVPVYPMLDGVILPAPQTLVDLMSTVSNQLVAFGARHAKPGLKIETEALQGAPAETIASFARDNKFDVIVMGTHGRTGFKHLALGSVTERVVRIATTPVLTIQSPEKATSKPAEVERVIFR